jgi:hypothetical protein
LTKRDNNPITALVVKKVAIMLSILGLLLSMVSCTTVSSQELDDFLAQLDTDLIFPGQSPGLIILVHGMNTRANQWPLRFERAIREIPGNESWDIVRISWRPHSDSALLSPAQAREIGAHLARQIVALDHDYQVIHGIGHSMAAHLLHGFVTTYRQVRAETPPSTTHLLGSSQFPGAFIHLTLLDPYVFLPPFRFWYGVRYFGREVDFLESFYTREDPVLFTNSRLRHGVNWVLDDLVPFRENSYQSYFHDYPIRYYEQSIGSESSLPGFTHSPLALQVFSHPETYMNFIQDLLSNRGRKIRLQQLED